MRIRYQGNETDTEATSVAEFLSAQGVKTEEAVVEYKGEILSGDAALAAPLEDGAELGVFRIVAGG